MSECKIKLSEKLVTIVNKIPWEFPLGPNLPDLLVEPSGFRRIVDNGMKTCKDFLRTLQDIQESIEKEIPGITSFYLLTSEGRKKSDILCNISGSIVNKYSYVPSTTTYFNTITSNTSDIRDMRDIRDVRERRYGMMDQPVSESDASVSDIQSEFKKAIFEKVGNVMLYKGRKLEQDEIISFYTSIVALEKTMSLKIDANYCISTIGSLQLALEVGKLYGRSTETIYFGERALQTETKPRDLLPIQNLWPIFAKVSVMNMILENLNEK